MPLRRFGPVLLLVTLVACGGGDDAPPSIPPPNTNPPGNGQNTQNPCVAALAQASSSDAPIAPALAADALGKGPSGLAADKRHVADLLWGSALSARAATRAAPAPDALDQDIGDIAVIEDDGTLLLSRNSLDTRNLGLRFERNGSGGYDVTPTTATFRSSLGRRLTLTDDDSKSETIPFAFSLLRAVVHVGLRQLRRQPDVRRGGLGLDAARLRPPARRAAARRAVLRRSGSVDRRTRLRRRRQRRAHRHLVRRPRLRLDADHHGAGVAVRERRDRREVRPRGDAGRRARRRVAGPRQQLHAGRSERRQPPGRRRRRGRRALRRRRRARHRAGGAPLLRDATPTASISSSSGPTPRS